MTYSYSNPLVSSWWFDRPRKISAAGEEIYEFLSHLKASVSIFDNIYTFNIDSGEVMSSVLNRQAIINALLANADAMPGHSSRDSEEQVFSRLGFTALLSTTPKFETDGCWIDIMCGRDEPIENAVAPNRIDLRLSPSLATPERLRTIFNQSVLYWKPTNAVVTNGYIKEALVQSDNAERVGWLTYVPSSGKITGLPLEFDVEAFAQGSVIRAGRNLEEFGEDQSLSRLVRLSRALAFEKSSQSRVLPMN